MKREDDFPSLMRRLCDLSVAHSYEPYSAFNWPAELPRNCQWMSTDLLSVHGTPRMQQLSAEQLTALSQWELANYFSFNVHGIRELMMSVLSHIHCSGFEDASEYFHHFIDEENKHMWFFAEFCRRYVGKVYYTQRLQLPSFEDPDVECFLTFARILISEQVSDYYNVRMMKDETLPPIVRRINRVHHEDESRHIAMGFRLVSRLHERLIQQHGEKMREPVARYLQRYMEFFVQSFYNPSAYRDAGVREPYELRTNLISHPARREFHERVLARSERFFKRHRILPREVA